MGREDRLWDRSIASVGIRSKTINPILAMRDYLLGDRKIDVARHDRADGEMVMDPLTIDLATKVIVYFLLEWYKTKAPIDGSLADPAPCEVHVLEEGMRERCAMFGLSPEKAVVLTGFIVEDVLLARGAPHKARCLNADGVMSSRDDVCLIAKSPSAGKVGLTNEAADALMLSKELEESLGEAINSLKFIISDRIKNSDPEEVLARLEEATSRLDKLFTLIRAQLDRIRSGAVTLAESNFLDDVKDAVGVVEELLGETLPVISRSYMKDAEALELSASEEAIAKRAQLESVRLGLEDVKNRMSGLFRFMRSVIDELVRLQHVPVVFTDSRRVDLKRDVLERPDDIAPGGYAEIAAALLNRLALKAPRSLVSPDVFRISAKKESSASRFTFSTAPVVEDDSSYLENEEVERELAEVNAVLSEYLAGTLHPTVEGFLIYLDVSGVGRSRLFGYLGEVLAGPFSGDGEGALPDTSTRLVVDGFGYGDRREVFMESAGMAIAVDGLEMAGTEVDDV